MARIRDEIGTTNGVRAANTGLAIERRFTRAGVHPFDELEWEVRDALIGDPAKPAFEQRDVEFPKSWSQNATNIVAQKYFRGQMGSPAARAFRQADGRPCGRHDRRLGARGRLLRDRGRRRRVRGRAQPHPRQPACRLQLTGLVQRRLRGAAAVLSACFILSVEDSMESILSWNTKEGMIFRGGSGSGINLSKIRSSKEQLSKGGLASGPVSFMRGADAWAGTIKSGGKTRRAAKMVVLDVDHPTSSTSSGARRKRGGQGRRAGRGRLRHVDRRRGLPLDPVPEREQLRARHGGIPRRRRSRRRVEDDRARQRRDDRHAQRPRPDERDRRGGLALRGPGHPVRHDDQRLAHVPEHRPHQRVQPVLRIHARRRLGLQPRVDQPAQVPQGRRHLRHGRVRAHGRRHVHGAGDRGRPVQLPDRGDRPQRARDAPARPRLREPRRAADGARPALRLARGPLGGRRDHGADDRPRVPDLG